MSFVNCHLKLKTWQLQFAIWLQMTEHHRSEKGLIFACHIEFKSLSGLFSLKTLDIPKLCNDSPYYT